MESIKHLIEVDGCRIITDEDRPRNNEGIIDWVEFDKMRDLLPIYINHEKDTISFNMMTKPASEGGKGCQLTALIATALEMLKYLNNKFSCRENAITITKLEEALMWQNARTKDRIKRGVEGMDQK